MENIYIYPESDQYLEWAHRVSIADKAKQVPISIEDYERLLAYDQIKELRTVLLERLWKTQE